MSNVLLGLPRHTDDDVTMMEPRDFKVWTETRQVLERVERAYDLHEYGLVLEYCRTIEESDKSGSSLFWLGLLHLCGEGVPQNQEEARSYFTRAMPLLTGAHESDSIAKTNLGWMYRNTDTILGVPQDDGKAFQLYLTAANHGLPRAQYNLGRMFQDGKGVEANLNEALRLFECASNAGYASAQLYFGHMHHAGVSVPVDTEKGLKWLLLAAEQGEPNSLYEVGWMYFHGKGVPEDKLKALDYYTRSALKGNASALNNLGWMFEKGHGVDQDLERAVAYYEAATKKGNSSAPYNLGRLFEQIPEKRPAAEGLFRLSASLGSSRAQYCLARFLYHTGIHEKRLEAKRIWEELVRDQNCVLARFDLAIFYLQGTTSSPDPITALQLLKQAQDQGHEGAKRKINELMSTNILSEEMTV